MGKGCFAFYGGRQGETNFEKHYVIMIIGIKKATCELKLCLNYIHICEQFSLIS